MGNVISHTGLASGPSLEIIGFGAALSGGRGSLFGGWVWVGNGFFERVCPLILGEKGPKKGQILTLFRFFLKIDLACRKIEAS